MTNTLSSKNPLREAIHSLRAELTVIYEEIEIIHERLPRLEERGARIVQALLQLRDLQLRDEPITGKSPSPSASSPSASSPSASSPSASATKGSSPMQKASAAIRRSNDMHEHPKQPAHPDRSIETTNDRPDGSFHLSDQALRAMASYIEKKGPVTSPTLYDLLVKQKLIEPITHVGAYRSFGRKLHTYPQHLLSRNEKMLWTLNKQ